MDGDDRICFVVPARNRAGHLRPLLCAVARRMQGLGRDWEIVFVDDGSGDDTPAVLHALAAEHPRVRAVRLARSSGHQVAVAAGLAHCGGAEAVVVDAASDVDSRRRDGARRPPAPTRLVATGLAAALAGLVAWLAVWLAAIGGAGLLTPGWTSTAAVSTALVFFSGVQLAGVGVAIRHWRRPRDEVAEEPCCVAVESIGIDPRRAGGDPEPAILRFAPAPRRRHARPVLREGAFT